MGNLLNYHISIPYGVKRDEVINEDGDLSTTSLNE